MSKAITYLFISYHLSSISIDLSIYLLSINGPVNLDGFCLAVGFSVVLSSFFKNYIFMVSLMVHHSRCGRRFSLVQVHHIVLSSFSWAQLQLILCEDHPDWSLKKRGFPRRPAIYTLELRLRKDTCWFFWCCSNPCVTLLPCSPAFCSITLIRADRSSKAAEPRLLDQQLSTGWSSGLQGI